MKKIIKILIIFISLNISVSGHIYPLGWDELQNNARWIEVMKTDRITIYRKKLDVSPIPAFKAELISNVNFKHLIETAWQVEKSVDIFPNAFIIDAGMYHYINDTTYVAYQIFDIPFLTPRLYQFNSIKVDNSIHWVKTDTINSDLFSNNLLIPPINFGSWQVKKMGNHTQLIYHVCTDPGGDIPTWIVTQANQRYLPQMLVDLENYAKDINQLNND